MAALAKGGVVLVPFPFSDLSRAKLRPAVVLAAGRRGDYLLCQVTSNPYADAEAVILTDESFGRGSLQRTSYARPGKLFTANEQLIKVQLGVLKAEVTSSVVEAVVRLLRTDF
ncbi:type II toxin-antitoxin system PemK/MazF family toxin [soil metagenome]